MRPHRLFGRPRRHGITLATCSGFALLALIRIAAPSAQAAAHDHMAMSAQAMQAKIDAWFATHPQTQSDQPLAAPVDTFFTGNNYFDNNGDGINGPDTAFVQPGDAVMWQWVAGNHTTTSGSSPGDPQAGVLWDSPPQYDLEDVRSDVPQ